MKDLIPKDYLFENDDVYCASCGTNMHVHVNRDGKVGYALDNGDYVCTKKCFKAYAEGYFNITPVKRDKK